MVHGFESALIACVVVQLALLGTGCLSSDEPVAKEETWRCGLVPTPAGAYCECWLRREHAEQFDWEDCGEDRQVFKCCELTRSIVDDATGCLCLNPEDTYGCDPQQEVPSCP